MSRIAATKGLDLISWAGRDSWVRPVPTSFGQLANGQIEVRDSIDSLGIGYAMNLGVLDRFDTEAARITSDAYLSAEGKRHALANLGRGLLNELSQRDYLLVAAREDLQRVRANIVVKPNETDPPTRAIRRAEIRTWLRDADSLKLAQLVLEETSKGQSDVLDAIQSAPMGMLPNVDPTVLAQAETMLADKRSPEAAARVRDLVEAIRVYEQTATGIAQHIRSKSGITPEAIVL